MSRQMKVTDTTKHKWETIREPWQSVAVVEEWFGVWWSMHRCATLLYTVAGGRPALAAAVAASIWKLCGIHVDPAGS